MPAIEWSKAPDTKILLGIPVTEEQVKELTTVALVLELAWGERKRREVTPNEVGECWDSGVLRGRFEFRVVEKGGQERGFGLKYEFALRGEAQLVCRFISADHLTYTNAAYFQTVRVMGTGLKASWCLSSPIFVYSDEELTAAKFSELCCAKLDPATSGNAEKEGTWSYYHRIRDEHFTGSYRYTPVQIGWIPDDATTLELFARFTPHPDSHFEAPPDVPCFPPVESKSKFLTLAWDLRHKFSYNAWRQQKISFAIEMLMIVCVLAGTTASCFLSFYRVQDIDTYNSIFVVLFPLSLVLPLAVTILIGVNKALKPYEKRAAFKLALTRVEGEIYRYRAQAGPYSKAAIAAAAEADEYAATMSPASAEAKSPEEQNNQRLVQLAWQKEDAFTGAADSAAEEEETGGGTKVVASIRSLLKPSKAGQKMASARKIFCGQLMLFWNELQKSDIEEGALIIPPRWLDPLDEVRRRAAHGIRMQQWAVDSLLMSSSDAGRRSFSQDYSCRRAWCGCCFAHPGSIKVDDGFSYLKPEDYKDLRVESMKADLSPKSLCNARILSVLLAFNIVLNTSSSILAALQLIVFIPVVSQLINSLNEWNRHNQTDKRLEKANKSLRSLELILIKWNGLGPEAKEEQENIDDLVLQTEEAILDEVRCPSGWSSLFFLSYYLIFLH